MLAQVLEVYRVAQKSSVSRAGLGAAGNGSRGGVGMDPLVRLPHLHTEQLGLEECGFRLPSGKPKESSHHAAGMGGQK